MTTRDEVEEAQMRRLAPGLGWICLITFVLGWTCGHNDDEVQGSSLPPIEVRCMMVPVP